MLVVAIAIDVAVGRSGVTDRDVPASEHTQAYHDPENAFPLAGRLAGLVCVPALVAPRSPGVTASAAFWLACAGSAGMYLFGMDLLDLEHGILTSGGGSAIEAVIVTPRRWSSRSPPCATPGRCSPRDPPSSG